MFGQHVIYCQDSEYVVAVRNYITEDRSVLSFHKGDIIRLQHMDGLEAGETHNQKHTEGTRCFREQCTVCASLFLCSSRHVHVLVSGVC